MTIQIQTRTEGRRGCGFRKPGGIYLVGPPEGNPCCRLPKELTVCPTCGHGIKPSRGWTWINVDALFFPEYDNKTKSGSWNVCQGNDIHNCPLVVPGDIGRAGLIWVGEVFYKNPADFLHEARLMGISRRITAIPKGFKLGETWVLLAHRKAIQTETVIESGLLKGTDATAITWTPAIFAIFKPTAMEYVVKGGETEAELERLVRRGLTPVEVNPRRAYK